MAVSLEQFWVVVLIWKQRQSMVLREENTVLTFLAAALFLFDKPCKHFHLILEIKHFLFMFEMS